MLWTGPAIHLWFLPFAYLASLMTFAVMRTARAQPTSGRVLWTLGLAVFALAALALGQGHVLSEPLPIPLAQWLYVLPALALGLLIAVQDNLRTGAIVALATASLLFGVGWVLDWQNGTEQLLLATAVTAVCVWVWLPSTRVTARAGEVALTVYLAHPLVASLLVRGADLPEASLSLAVGAFGGALAIGIVIERLRVLQPRPA